MASAELWTQERNLSFQAGRETLIYILGRVGREDLPPEVWVFIATHVIFWNSVSQEVH
jgi:hypothetical protein